MKGEKLNWYKPFLVIMSRQTLFQLKTTLQSNWMFSCEQRCNIVPQYCNRREQIAS